MSDSDERPTRLYTCPLCEEETKAVYTHPLGQEIAVFDALYVIGACFPCLKVNDPDYAKKVRAAEGEAKTYRLKQRGVIPKDS